MDFGIVRVGADVIRTINLKNKSKKTVKFSLTDSANDLSKLFLSYHPGKDKECQLKPKEVLPIELRFKP